MRWQDGGPWAIHEPKTDANEEFRQIVNVYSSDKKRPKKQSVSKAEIYELMGYGKQAFSNIINGITKLGPKSDQQED